MKKLLYLLPVSICIILFFYAQERIVSPKRKPLEPHHTLRLNNPAKYNLNIYSYFTQKEHTPYLYVTFNDTQALEKRAKTVRHEIKAMDRSIDFRDRDATIIMLHGKNTRKEDILPIAQRYTALGFRCLLIDIPAHGQSPLKRLYYGTKAYEKVYVDRVIDDLQRHHTINQKRLFLWGYSLGGAFAIRSAYHSRYDFKGMVLVSTFDSLEGVLADRAQRLLGSYWGVHVNSLLHWSLEVFYSFDTTKADAIALAKQIHTPLFLAHGQKDSLIALWRGKRLFDAFASSPKVLAIDPDATHNTIFITPQKFYAQSGYFLLQQL